MIKKRNDYESVSAESEFTALPPGGYVCKIVSLKEACSKAGNDMLVAMLDIYQGEYQNYFGNIYDARRREKGYEAKYPNDGIAYIVTCNSDGTTNRKFKGFCTALEDSGYEVWRNGEFLTKELEGSLIGVLFRREEREYDGRSYWNTKPYQFRSVDRIMNGEFEVPKDLPLSRPQSFNQPFSPSFNQSDNPAPFAAIDEDIPF